MPGSSIFVFQNPAHESQARTILRRLPPLEGAPLRIETACGLRDRHGEVNAGAFLRERRIVFNCTRTEFPRIFVHELFHFIWLRLGNAPRLSYEALVRGEYRAGARGELGWSAEWRKGALGVRDLRRRTRRWREYCCESFCDTAAWLYSGIRLHPEFNLAGNLRKRRRDWFQESIGGRQLPL